MKILIDTESKTITVLEDVNIGELFKYLESHFTDTKPFSNGWRDYKLTLSVVNPFSPLGTVGGNVTIDMPSINIPSTTNPFNPTITTPTRVPTWNHPPIYGSGISEVTTTSTTLPF